MACTLAPKESFCAEEGNKPALDLKKMLPFKLTKARTPQPAWSVGAAGGCTNLLGIQKTTGPLHPGRQLNCQAFLSTREWSA